MRYATGSVAVWDGMAQRIVIRFPADRPSEYYTNVFYFAESLWSPVVHAGFGQLNDIDRAREVIWIDVSSKRHLGAVRAIVKKALDKHQLAADAIVTAEKKS